MNSLAKAAAQPPLLPAIDQRMIERAVTNPLDLLPAAWQLPVWAFWGRFASLLKSQLDLVMTLRDWIEDEGLTLAEAQRAFRALTSPAARAKIVYPGDVIAHLADRVAWAMTDRKRDERIARDRAQAEADRQGARRTVVEQVGKIGVGGA